MKQSKRVHEIVLTGGPGSGKTTAMSFLVEHLTQRGWRVLVVPEAATMLIAGGIRDMGDLAANRRATFLKVQENLVLLQDSLRQRFLSIADDLADEQAGLSGAEPKVVVLYDRAELDNRAYMNAEEFDLVLRSTLDRPAVVVGEQYDAVLCLMSAANGVGYTTENNDARSESIEQAVALDRAVQAAWLGHPHLTVIGNEASFDLKLTRVLAAVLNALGEPEPVEVERKWLLAFPPPAEMLASAVPVDIEQVYLPDVDGAEQRVRARTHEGHTTYFHTTKRPTTDAVGRVEHEVQIDADAYRLLAAMKTPGTSVVRKRRYCFVSDGQHFELDQFSEPVIAWLLEAELVTAGDPVRIPHRLDVAVEVTDDPEWRNSALARL